MNTTLLAIFAVAYLIGSIPFGIVFCRMFGLGDPRQQGSGGTGATNVLRTGHKGAAVLTLIFDAGKGALVVLGAVMFAEALVDLAAQYMGLVFPTVGATAAATIAGLGAFLGHLFPLYTLFRGGKGVATYLGILGALHWPAGLTAVGIWLMVAVLFRISSLSALVMVAAMPFVLSYFGQDGFVWLAVLLGVLIMFAHASNMERMFLGQEPRIGRRSTDP